MAASFPSRDTCTWPESGWLRSAVSGTRRPPVHCLRTRTEPPTAGTTVSEVGVMMAMRALVEGRPLVGCRFGTHVGVVSAPANNTPATAIGTQRGALRAAVGRRQRHHTAKAMMAPTTRTVDT